MTNRLGKYEILIWTASEDLREMGDACIQATWDAGHSARSRISSIASMNIQEWTRDADLFVCLCRTADEDVRRHCRLAGTNLKPVLLFLIGNNLQEIPAELQKIVESGPDGSRSE